MIAYLRGKPIKKTLDYTVLNVGGVGYKVFTPLSTLCNIDINKETELYIETILREDSISLYGFFTENEKNVFNKLLSVSKVGPKLALTILSGLSPEKLIAAIKGRNLKLLTSIPGVGKKTAERICFDLKDTFSETDIDSESSESGNESIEQDIVTALTGLGYKPSEVKGIIKNTVAKYPEESLENLLKIILNDLYNG
jgi:Holliday junction DNA helicase RuvA